MEYNITSLQMPMMVFGSILQKHLFVDELGYVDLDETVDSILKASRDTITILYGSPIVPRTDRSIVDGFYTIFVREDFEEITRETRVALALELAMLFSISRKGVYEPLVPPSPDTILKSRELLEVLSLMLLVPFPIFEQAIQKYPAGRPEGGKQVFSAVDVATELDIPESTLTKANILYGQMQNAGILEQVWRI